MTPLVLLDTLKEFIELETKDIILPVKVDRGSTELNERAATVFKMSLPNKEANIQRIPYILLQFLKSTDLQEAGQETESDGIVRIVGATYSENGEEGAMAILNLLTRIRIALLKSEVIGGQFLLQKPLELIVYPDNTPPYFLGEMITNWKMPTIEREV